MSVVVWFRRDLRVRDNGVLAAAADWSRRADDDVLPLFIVDPEILRRSGSSRVDVMIRSLGDLNNSIGGALRVALGRPDEVLPRLVAECGANLVLASSDVTWYARRRDLEVAAALGPNAVDLRYTDHLTVLPPGSIRKSDGSRYAVFTPYYKVWRESARSVAPIHVPELRFDAAQYAAVEYFEESLLRRWTDIGSQFRHVVPVGEVAAVEAWANYRNEGLASYGETRNLPSLRGTSMLSSALHFGALHPRTILGDLGPTDQSFLSEICWREFYADVLLGAPSSSWRSLAPWGVSMEWNDHSSSDGAERLVRWKEGRTGFPIVDAGMRQLLQEHWMHNRVRMIVASFLVKDLHFDWQVGAAHFNELLDDGDVASNAHGWQWVAGTGTDASPFFRVFNPILQGERFDPEGVYVRRYVPELRFLSNALVHRPWEATRDRTPNALFSDAPTDDSYPAPMVDHVVERDVALERYRAARGVSLELFRSGG